MQESTLPLVYDFAITEGETNAMLRLVQLKFLRDLKTIKDRRLQTTLVAPTHELNQVLANQLVIVMYKEGQIIPIAPPAPVGRNQSTDYQGIWQGFVPKPYNIGRDIEAENSPSSYAARRMSKPMKQGESKPSISHYTPYLTASKTTKISAWVDQSSTQPAEDPFAPSQDPKQSATVVDETAPSAQLSDLPAQQQEPRKRAAKARKPMGAAAIEQEAPHPIVTSITKNDVDSVPATDPYANIDLLFDRVSQASGAVNAPQAFTSLKPRKPTGPQADPDGPLIDISIQPSPPLQNPAALPELKPPYMPAHSSISSMNSRATSTPDWAYKGQCNVEEGQLIDITENVMTTKGSKKEAHPNRKTNSKPLRGSTTQQKIVKSTKDTIADVAAANTSTTWARADNEVASRQYRNTMRQKKAKATNQQTMTGAIDAYNDAAMQILTFVRKAQGCIEIESTIGRFFIDNKSGSKQWKNDTFSINQWREAFPNKQGHVRFNAHLADRVTTLASDADAILDLRLSSGVRCSSMNPLPGSYSTVLSVRHHIRTETKLSSKFPKTRQQIVTPMQLQSYSVVSIGIFLSATGTPSSLSVSVGPLV